MPEVHLSVSVIEDGVLYNLTDIKRDVLNDGEIEQCPFRRHLENVRRQNETGGGGGGGGVIKWCHTLGI